MTEDPSDRRATSSSERCLESDPDELLLSELSSTLMTPNEAGRDRGEDGPDKWGDGEARGDKCGRVRRMIR
jgi:hypothetical protein